MGYITPQFCGGSFKINNESSVKCSEKQSCRLDWRALAEKALTSTGITRGEALAVLRADESDLLEILAAAYRLRRETFGRSVNLHVIQNARSGSCSENCGFCSQSAVSKAGIGHYPLRSAEEIAAGARQADKMNAAKYCIVTSGRAPAEDAVETMCAAARQIRAEGIKLSICVSMGLASAEQLRRLAKAGVNRYNHNLETARRFFPEICSTHSYDERAATVRMAKAAGLEVCCGGIIGLGESLEDRVELAFELRELGVDSIPVNLFNPRPGTPFEKKPPLAALAALRALAMFRFVNPRRDIRAAGGREACLGPLQPLALFAANSVFTEGYLTTAGQGYSRDMEIIRSLGFEVGRIEA
ncbi:MAG: biotin synthase BioB [Kiritimatiellae bacterium]|nr:biotin synthase BioB [Kiritimatiellia bacterium]